jgi:hypothetical protein
MLPTNGIWLVVNSASGSHDEEALAGVASSCQGAGLAIERIVSFPKEPLPTGGALDGAGISTIAVFAGDGTVNALVRALDGWSGAVLVLPGGTMNLLYHRLHAERPIDEVVRLAAAGQARRARPGVIRCSAGTAFADLLAGPGTSWHQVREAMRETDIVGVAAHAAQALGATLAEPGVACRHPESGRTRDYPLIMLTPTDRGIVASGYCAETAGEYVEGGWAVLRRRFREGPHDELGLAPQVTLTSTTGDSISLLLDGEPAECPAEQVFRLVPCGVDLLATGPDGR